MAPDIKTDPAILIVTTFTAADGITYEKTSSVERSADLEQRLAKAESALKAMTTLAVFFQDDYSIKLPVVAAFRRWRGGHLSTEEFLKRLGEDDLANVLRYEKAPPMDGLAILSRYRNSHQE